MITRSIFDPGNPNVERSGNTMTPAKGRNYSKMPEDHIDGVLEAEEVGRDAVEFNETGQPVEPPPVVEGQVSEEEGAGTEQVQAGDEPDAAGQDAFENPEQPLRQRPGH